jgi:glycosyltransferase involved in cell wall biosynthesis
MIGLYKFLLSKKTEIICDCHTKALKRKINGKLGKIFTYIKSMSFRFVNLSIISNHGLTQEISKYTKYFFILPDPIPEINTIKLLKDKNYSIFVCSYASDEPLKEVIKAAEILIGFTLIICTGKIPKNLLYIKNEKFKNIRFTDYLSYNVYVDMINNARCIIALTKEDDCLQCGGYEGLAVGVPIVVSDTTALREYFLDSAVYVENAAKEIAEGIIYAINNKEKLSINMEKIKNKRKNEFKKQISQLKKSISIIH